MPKRRRLLATWTAAALLVAAAFGCLTMTGPASTDTVQRAGFTVSHLLAAGLLTAAVSLMTPTALFVWRRRQYRHILISERG